MVIIIKTDNNRVLSCLLEFQNWFKRGQRVKHKNRIK